MSHELLVENSRILLKEGDITQQCTDGIVNAANSNLIGGGGVDGAIHEVGGPVILEECRKIISRIGKLSAGKAVITTGGDLKAKYVIHAVGPVWHGGRGEEASLLASAYLDSLKLATSYKLTSISFPSISTGAYGYPVVEAASIALKSVVRYLLYNKTPLIEIWFILYDQSTYQVYINALSEVAF